MIKNLYKGLPISLIHISREFYFPQKKSLKYVFSTKKKKSKIRISKIKKKNFRSNVSKKS
jgi:hypothetical protein